MEKDLEMAKCYLGCCGYSLAVVKEGAVAVTSREEGIISLLMAQYEYPEVLEGSSVADKVVGKAAAFIMVEARVKEVYGAVMSEPAVAVLEAHGVGYRYCKLVPQIMDRDGRGLCPMEKTCEGIDDPIEAILAITAVICRSQCGGAESEEGTCRCT